MTDDEKRNDSSPVVQTCTCMGQSSCLSYRQMDKKAVFGNDNDFIQFWFAPLVVFPHQGTELEDYIWFASAHVCLILMMFLEFSRLPTYSALGTFQFQQSEIP